LGRQALGLLMTLALGLALTIGQVVLQPHPTAAATAAPEPPAAADPINTGSFRLGTVRILGVPVITVASSAVGSDSGPEASEQARVIEGNLSQLYEPRNPCTPGERVGEALLDHLSVEGTKAACDPNHLGLQRPPQALRVVVLREAGGGQQLASLVPGRSSPFPLLTVTGQDAAFNGLPADALAEQWRGLLERRLRSARSVFGQEQINGRLQIALVSLAGLALRLALVLVVQEIFGVHAYIQDVCRRLAQLGYLAIAPSLFDRQGDVTVLPDIAAILTLVATVPDAQVMADLDATAAWAAASGEGDVTQLGITGFCWGGRITWLYAAHNPKLKAGVAWYGRLVGTATGQQPLFPIDVVSRLKAPVLGLYAGQDDGIPMESVQRMQAALKAAGSPSRIEVFPGVPHGFHADYRPIYHAAAAGWTQMRAWFRANGVV
jgi:carboxymethylenebutenolidase